MRKKLQINPFEFYDYIKGISQADLITFEQLAEAFKEVCKNLKTWQELKKATGLSNERAKNIFGIYQKLL